MRMFPIMLVTALTAAPVFAQHEGHSASAIAAEPPAAAQQPMVEVQAAADPHAGHVMPAAEPVADEHAGHVMSAAEQAVDEHAGHVMSAAEPVADEHAGHVMPAAEPVDEHAGHVMPAAELVVDEHAGHDMSTMTEAGTPAAESAAPSEAFSGPLHAADTFFDPSLMAAIRENMRIENGDIKTFWISADQAETRIRDGGDKAYVWDAQGWYGGDINKIWIKSEGEGSYHESPGHAEVQALWSHAIAPFWDFQAGVRHDFRPKSGRTHAVVGIQGLMPYQFELDAAAFVSDDGDVSARVEAEYDQRITQRLILQPRVEMDVSGANIPERGLGSGLSSAALGLRLRYEFFREFAPYIGMEYARSFGSTADYVHLAGEDVGGWNFVMGIRTWF